MAQIHIQIATEENLIPHGALLEQWSKAAIPSEKQKVELGIRIVDKEEMQQLNLAYRGKDSATNVLSFPMDIPDEIDIEELGDVVICAEVVEHEAREQNKNRHAHWAHMVIHGTLHLQGYDHIDDADADVMEGLETRILAQLGFPPPYATKE